MTDGVVADVGACQARPLEPMYPVVFFDALRVKIREDAVLRKKAVYLTLGVLPDGTRDILGLWIEGTEGAKFWMKVFNGQCRSRRASQSSSPNRRSPSILRARQTSRRKLVLLIRCAALEMWSARTKYSRRVCSSKPS